MKNNVSSYVEAWGPCLPSLHILRRLHINIPTAMRAMTASAASVPPIIAGTWDFFMEGGAVGVEAVTDSAEVTGWAADDEAV